MFSLVECCKPSCRRIPHLVAYTVDVPDVFLWDGPTLVETRQIWLENKDKPLPPIPSPYVYDRTRAIVSAVKDVISKAEVSISTFPHWPPSSHVLIALIVSL
jgi:hypothetical protein